MNQWWFEKLVEDELRSAREKYAAPFHGRHEALGVIREEYKELEGEVFKKKPWDAELLGELVQVAAMCRRAAEDLKLCGKKSDWMTGSEQR